MLRSLALLAALSTFVLAYALWWGGPTATQGTGQANFPPDVSNFPAQLNILSGGDPLNLQAQIHMPTNMLVSFLTIETEEDSNQWEYHLLGTDPFLDIVEGTSFAVVAKEQDGDWSITSFSSAGAVGPFQGVSASFTGHVAGDGSSVTGLYVLGENGAFGGPTVTYQIKAKPPGATPATSTPFPSSTPTATATPTRTPTPTPTLTPMPGPSKFNIAVSVLADPLDLQEQIQMPTNISLNVTVVPGSQVDAITITGPSPWVNLSGNLGAGGFFHVTGFGTVAGVAGVGVELNGLYTAGNPAQPLSGTLNMGTNGTLPNQTTVSYIVESKTGTPLVSPTSPEQTPTRTPTPGGSQTSVPTPTRTPTGPTPTATRTPTPTRPPYGSGDVNKDGRVDSIDALLVLQFTAGEIDLGQRFFNADTNQDGEVTSVDATLILQRVAGRIPSLPVPRPN